ncbi:hypothetical protein FRC19_004898 [Serendipita sp. 401]|nr:hypothetical protein FRC19_004898 [Serendipita sp. 401]
MMIWNHFIRAAVDAVVRVEMTDALRAVQYAIVMQWIPADGLLKLKVVILYLHSYISSSPMIGYHTCGF